MTQIDVNQHEHRLITVLRAIQHFGQVELVGGHEASNLLAGLESVFDFSKLEEALHPEELKALVLGFVGGIAAIAKSENPLPDYIPAPEESLPVRTDLDESVAGVGPSSAIPRGQAEGDPRYVVQTGPRKDQEV